MEQAASRISSSPRAWQRPEDVLAVFWDRKVSPWFTRVFVRVGVTPNQATLLWGALSAANSYTVYRAATGDYWLIPAVWAIYVLCSVIDCSDGEIARATNRVNPVAGKLLDGICHRTTEYALVGAFGLAAWTLTASTWVLPITVALVTGDAMQSYVYERRISILRVQQRVTGPLQHAQTALYTWGTPWTALTARQKLSTFTGMFHYKSVYPVMAIAYISPLALLIGLAAIAVHKHVKWIRLLARTLGATNATPATAEAAQ